MAHGFGLVKQAMEVPFIGSVFPSKSSVWGLTGLSAAWGLAACVFTPPPPLPEELAEAPAAAGGDTNPSPGGSVDAAAAEPAFAEGDPPAVGMTHEEMQAYATSQGDPRGGVFELADALAGVEGEGALWAVLELEAGQMECELFEAQAPLTVANFVGLARGLRPFKDPQGGGWVERPYYDGTIFHRAIPGFMVQGGDPLGTGRGGPGYVIPDEIRAEFSHDRAGRLSMANRGAGTGGSQFFVTLGPALYLDGVHTIFGQCSEPSIELAEGIASTAGANDRPQPEAAIVRIRVERRG